MDKEELVAGTMPDEEIDEMFTFKLDLNSILRCLKELLMKLLSLLKIELPETP